MPRSAIDEAIDRDLATWRAEQRAAEPPIPRRLPAEHFYPPEVGGPLFPIPPTIEGQEEVLRAGILHTEPPPGAYEYAKTALGAGARALLEVPASTFEAAEFLERPIVRSLLGERAARALVPEVGQTIRRFGEAVTPAPSGELSESYLATKIPAALGSAAGFMAGGIAGRALKIPGWLGISTLGAANQGVSGYKDAVSKGATDEQASAAFWLNALAGTTEAVPLAGFLNRLDRLSGGTLKDHIVRSGKGAFEEALQEAFTAEAGNQIAKNIVAYDPARRDFDNIAESAGIGGIVGAVLGFATSAVGAKLGRMRAATEPPLAPAFQPDRPMAPMQPEVLTPAPVVVAPTVAPPTPTVAANVANMAAQQQIAANLAEATRILSESAPEVAALAQPVPVQPVPAPIPVATVPSAAPAIVPIIPTVGGPSATPVQEDQGQLPPQGLQPTTVQGISRQDVQQVTSVAAQPVAPREEAQETPTVIPEQMEFSVTHLSSNLESLRKGFESRDLGISFARITAEEMRSPTEGDRIGKKGRVFGIVKGAGLNYANPAHAAFINSIPTNQLVATLRKIGVDFVNNFNGIGHANELYVINPGSVDIRAVQETIGKQRRWILSDGTVARDPFQLSAPPEATPALVAPEEQPDLRPDLAAVLGPEMAAPFRPAQPAAVRADPTRAQQLPTELVSYTPVPETSQYSEAIGDQITEGAAVTRGAKSATAKIALFRLPDSNEVVGLPTWVDRSKGVKQHRVGVAPGAKTGQNLKALMDKGYTLIGHAKLPGPVNGTSPDSVLLFSSVDEAQEWGRQAAEPYQPPPAATEPTGESETEAQAFWETILERITRLGERPKALIQDQISELVVDAYEEDPGAVLPMFRRIISDPEAGQRLQGLTQESQAKMLFRVLSRKVHEYVSKFDTIKGLVEDMEGRIREVQTGQPPVSIQRPEGVPRVTPSAPGVLFYEGPSPEVAAAETRYDAEIATGDGRAVLNAIATRSTNPDNQVLARALLASGVSSRVVVADQPTAGAYRWREDTVSLSPAAGLQEEVLLHEFVHAGTHREVSDPTSPLRKEASDFVRSMTQAERQRYGITNENEFVARANTDSAFQEYLRNKSYGKQSLWQRFLNVVRRIFGLPQRFETVLERVISRTRQVLEQRQAKESVADRVTSPNILFYESQGTIPPTITGQRQAELTYAANSLARIGEQKYAEYERARNELEAQSEDKQRYNQAVETLNNLAATGQKAASDQGWETENFPVPSDEDFGEKLRRLGIQIQPEVIQQLSDTVRFEKRAKYRAEQLRTISQLERTIVAYRTMGLPYDALTEELERVQRNIANAPILDRARATQMVNQEFLKPELEAQRAALLLTEVDEVFGTPIAESRRIFAQLQGRVQDFLRLIADPNASDGIKKAASAAVAESFLTFADARRRLAVYASARKKYAAERSKELEAQIAQSKIDDGSAQVLLDDLRRTMQGEQDLTGSVVDQTALEESLRLIRTFADQVALSYPLDGAEALVNRLSDPSLGITARAAQVLMGEDQLSLVIQALRSSPAYRNAAVALTKWANKRLASLPSQQIERLRQALEDDSPEGRAAAQDVFDQLRQRLEKTIALKDSASRRDLKELYDLMVERRSLERAEELFDAVAGTRDNPNPDFDRLRATVDLTDQRIVRQMLVENGGDPNNIKGAGSTYKKFGDMTEDLVIGSGRSAADLLQSSVLLQQQKFQQLKDYYDRASLYVARYKEADSLYRRGQSQQTPESQGLDGPTARGLEALLLHRRQADLDMGVNVQAHRLATTALERSLNNRAFWRQILAGVQQVEGIVGRQLISAAVRYFNLLLQMGVVLHK